MSLPAGWTFHQDPGSGRSYYFNASTGVSSWEVPRAALIPPPPPPPPPQPAASTLPAGWTEHTDQGSGKSFFHNATTGVVQWESPAAAGAATAPPVAAKSSMSAIWAISAQHDKPKAVAKLTVKPVTAAQVAAAAKASAGKIGLDDFDHHDDDAIPSASAKKAIKGGKEEKSGKSDKKMEKPKKEDKSKKEEKPKKDDKKAAKGEKKSKDKAAK